jgi:hypothetical protein
MKQTDAILLHLQSGRTITPIDALSKYGCFRLGARIFDLKEAGHPIEKEMVTDPETEKRFARYWLQETCDRCGDAGEVSRQGFCDHCQDDMFG